MEVIKRNIVLIVLIAAILPPDRVSAQGGVAAAIAGAVKKVIKAVDLKIQREQNKVIWLQNAQKTLENAMSKLKLTEISEWTEKQRMLYDTYFQELRKVKSAIATYQKVRSVVQRQLQLVSEYKRAWGLLRQDKHFSPAELDQMYRIYTGIFDESLKNIDQLMLVTCSFATQMSDGKRLELIDMADKNLEQNLMDVRGFNIQNFRLSISRAKNQSEAELTGKMYGIK